MRPCKRGYRLLPQVVLTNRRNILFKQIFIFDQIITKHRYDATSNLTLSYPTHPHTHTPGMGHVLDNDRKSMIGNVTVWE